MPPESSRQPLPFEPNGKAKSAGKSSGQPGSAKPVNPRSPASPSATGIPEVVSQRMLRRMLFFSGIPTGLGVVTFFASYFLIVKVAIELPPYLVLLTTLGCFGLGVVGLTYGVLSASWDEDRPGTWLGLGEFKVNFGRMTSAWGSRAKP
ncbi:MAG: PAM68 family protein [Nodosilinea sp. LVE1205-7]